MRRGVRHQLYMERRDGRLWAMQKIISTHVRLTSSRALSYSSIVLHRLFSTTRLVCSGPVVNMSAESTENGERHQRNSARFSSYVQVQLFGHEEPNAF